MSQKLKIVYLDNTNTRRIVVQVVQPDEDILMLARTHAKLDKIESITLAPKCLACTLELGDQEDHMVEGGCLE